MTTDARRALLLSGSTRVGSTNTAVLRTLASMAPPWVTAVLYAGLSALLLSTLTTAHPVCRRWTNSCMTFARPILS